MENLSNNYEHIKGWGVDADPENEPTYPMKKYTGDDHRRLNYDAPVQQPETVEILMSNERPRNSAVFGTSAPPTGLSGKIRRFAFQYSEGSFAHWIPLILADRVNAIECLVQEIRNGQFPNIIAERGWTAEWKYNRKAVIKNSIIGAFVVAGLIGYFAKRNSRS